MGLKKRILSMIETAGPEATAEALANVADMEQAAIDQGIKSKEAADVEAVEAVEESAVDNTSEGEPMPEASEEAESESMDLSPLMDALGELGNMVEAQGAEIKSLKADIATISEEANAQKEAAEKQVSELEAVVKNLAGQAPSGVLRELMDGARAKSVTEQDEIEIKEDGQNNDPQQHPAMKEFAEWKASLDSGNFA